MQISEKTADNPYIRYYHGKIKVQIRKFSPNGLAYIEFLEDCNPFKKGKECFVDPEDLTEACVMEKNPGSKKDQIQKLHEKQAFNEIRQMILDNEAYPLRWCEVKQAAVPIRELTAEICCDCKFFIGNEGICDPL